MVVAQQFKAARPLSHENWITDTSHASLQGWGPTIGGTGPGLIGPISIIEVYSLTLINQCPKGLYQHPLRLKCKDPNGQQNNYFIHFQGRKGLPSLQNASLISQPAGVHVWDCTLSSWVRESIAGQLMPPFPRQE